MSIQKVLQMAEKFVRMAEEGKQGTVIQSPNDIIFTAQRERLARFYDNFTRQLRIIISEMGSDLFTLKNRDFDGKIFKMFAKVYQDLISLSKEIKEDKPYIAAQKLVHYTLEKPNRSLLENIDFLAKHHTKSTNVDFKPTSVLKHPEIRSLDALTKLATQLKEFMTQHPMVEVLLPSTVPPPRLRETVETIPEFQTGPGEKTNAALPFSKRK